MSGEEDGRHRDDEVALARLRRICLSFDGASEATLQDRPLFRVGRRRFAIFNGAGAPPRRRWNGWGRSLHFLADPVELPALHQDPRFRPSPHHGDRGWLGLSLQAAVDWDEVGELLQSAYDQARPRSRPADNE